MATDNHKCSSKCSDLEHIKSEDVKDNEYVFLDCEEMGYKTVAVRAKHKDILDVLKETKENCMRSMLSALKHTRNVDIDKIYNENGQAWQDFCDDVAIYYAARFKVTNKLIPICKMPENDLD
jgi:tRNA U34 5-methylaminomethyl-2-thiouridine-forming methyltransferase MnmC